LAGKRAAQIQILKEYSVCSTGDSSWGALMRKILILVLLVLLGGSASDIGMILYFFFFQLILVEQNTWSCNILKLSGSPYGHAAVALRHF
jgi:hypothetical protein